MRWGPHTHTHRGRGTNLAGVLYSVGHDRLRVQAPPRHGHRVVQAAVKSLHRYKRNGTQARTRRDYVTETGQGAGKGGMGQQPEEARKGAN